MTIKSIRSEIDSFIKSYNYTLRYVSELSGINHGHLSEILRGKRSLTILHLDALSNIFNQPLGWLYELYHEECFLQGKVSKSRIQPYLIRCAKINRYDCIEKILPQLLDNIKNLSIIFSIAEKLYKEGDFRESLFFYQIVVNNDSNSYSDRFVISKYRIFRILLGTDAARNLKAVIQFEPYRNRLREDYQLDALLKLANTCYTLKQWEEVEKYADELIKLAKIVYEEERRKIKSKKKIRCLETERHLVVYYGQGYLLKSLSLQKRGLYNEAKKYLKGYADLSWFELVNDLAKKEIENFRICAEANMFTLELLEGNSYILPEYINYLINHPAELQPGLLTVMESANKHDFNVDDILKHFSYGMDCFNNYENEISMDRHLQFCFELATYHFKHGRFINGNDEILKCLTLSHKMNNHQDFKKCVAIFETYKSYRTHEQDEKYQKIMKEVLQYEEITTFVMPDNRTVC